MGARGVAVLGSTGSIGRTTLEVIDAFPDRYRVVALTAHASAESLARQIERYRPELAVLADGGFPGRPAEGTRLAEGPDAVVEAARHPDAEIVVNGLVGAAGLEPTLAALEAGKRLALANKESLVVAGPLVMQAVERHGGELIPVDSEHSAVFQCLRGERIENVERIVLTASGGPFRERDRSSLDEVTPEQALRHPTWQMGAKITVDSATLVNKALELVEAHYLFGLSYDRIDVLIHPQSIVHSLVELRDGSVIAHLSQPTMQIPILYALSYPERLAYDPPRLDLGAVASLTFEEVTGGRFPAFELGREAALRGGTAPAAFNAANEEAVSAFLEGVIAFTYIPEVIDRVLSEHVVQEVTELSVVREADTAARRSARRYLKQIAEKSGRFA